ncbi:hypothetical protein [Nocardia sp. GP40]|uniref:hypothetical protein n=1 Tax=Nocardia sp. GP40 TaxID=3156268 RepID=UPI003D1E08A5
MSLETQLTAFDLGFMRLIPGIDSAPPLDAQPSVHVSRMAKEWISVDLTMRSLKAKADHEELPDPVEVPAKARLENCCADYTRMIEDIRTGTRRLRRPDDDPPPDTEPPHERP